MANRAPLNGLGGRATRRSEADGDNDPRDEPRACLRWRFMTTGFRGRATCLVYGLVALPSLRRPVSIQETSGSRIGRGVTSRWNHRHGNLSPVERSLSKVLCARTRRHRSGQVAFEASSI